jgi:hypothetical protein
MLRAYKSYKKYFTSLLSENIPEEDKKRISNLIRKPWQSALIPWNTISVCVT